MLEEGGVSPRVEGSGVGDPEIPMLFFGEKVGGLRFGKGGVSGLLSGRVEGQLSVKSAVHWREFMVAPPLTSQIHSTLSIKHNFNLKRVLKPGARALA